MTTSSVYRHCRIQVSHDVLLSSCRQVFWINMASLVELLGGETLLSTDQMWTYSDHSAYLNHTRSLIQIALLQP